MAAGWLSPGRVQSYAARSFSGRSTARTRRKVKRPKKVDLRPRHLAYQAVNTATNRTMRGFKRQHRNL